MTIHITSWRITDEHHLQRVGNLHTRDWRNHLQRHRRSFLFLGIIATTFAMYLWNTAFAILDVSTILGAFFLGEIITSQFLFGGLVLGRVGSKYSSKCDLIKRNAT